MNPELTKMMFFVSGGTGLGSDMRLSFHFLKTKAQEEEVTCQQAACCEWKRWDLNSGLTSRPVLSTLKKILMCEEL